jgi:hypothetical protein
MKRLFFMVLGLGLFFCAMTSAAQAQATRTWVSGLGDDANPCSRTAPCKTFPGAYSRTAVGGEIDVIDPGGFGTVTISKSLTIDGGGGQVASILASSVNAVVINGGASDRVILRNLRINGISQSSFPGLSAVVFNSGLSLIIENTNIENFSVNGVTFQPTVASSLTIINSSIENCGNDGILFSTAASGGGVNRGTVRNTMIANSGKNGVEVGANSRMELYSGMSSRNGLIVATGDGVVANGGANTFVDLDDMLISDNGGNGIHAQSSSIIRVSNSSLNNNGGLGVSTDGGVGQAFSGLNNRVKGNLAGDGTFTGPIPLS